MFRAGVCGSQYSKLRRISIAEIAFCSGKRIGEAGHPGPYAEGGSSSSGAQWEYTGHSRWERLGVGIQPELRVEVPSHAGPPVNFVGVVGAGAGRPLASAFDDADDWEFGVEAELGFPIARVEHPGHRQSASLLTDERSCKRRRVNGRWEPRRLGSSNDSGVAMNDRNGAPRQESCGAETVESTIDLYPRLVDIAHMAATSNWSDEAEPAQHVANGNSGGRKCAECNPSLMVRGAQWRMCRCGALVCVDCGGHVCNKCAGSTRGGSIQQGVATVTVQAPKGDDTARTEVTEPAERSPNSEHRRGRRARRNAQRSWSVVTCNGSGAGPLKDAMGAISVDDNDNIVAFLGQEHRQRGDNARQLEDWAPSHGWTLAAADANSTQAESTSGGCLVAVRKHMTLGKWPSATDNTLVPGRAAGAFLQA